MEYTIKAIPTTYQGVRFRSRLEARWAAFFDLLGFRWNYEPYDLNRWAPDFELKTRGGGRVLVEVKPFLWEGKDPFEFIDDDLRIKVGGHSGVVVGAEMNPYTHWDNTNAYGVQLYPVHGWCSAQILCVSPSEFSDLWRQSASESKREYA